MEHTAVGMAFIRRSAGILAPVQRDKVREFECAGTDYSAGKSSNMDKMHDGINE
jgi:hypothetical protein